MLLRLVASALVAVTLLLELIGMVEMEAPLRFAIQGDIHNFRRIPKPYLQNLLADAKSIGCAFVAFLGDSFNGTKENPMQLSRESPVPIVWQRGDHEFFSEWGRTVFVRLSQRHELLGEAPDPLAFFRGAIPRFEAMTGQPTAWAFVLRGILFVVLHNGKNHVWHDWQIRWLRQILSENRNKTTVLLSHRTLDERGETANALRDLLSEFPQVILFCDAHIHRHHPFRLFGNTLQVGVEGNSGDEGKTYERDWYVVVELAKDALRVFKRRMATSELVKLHERKTATTLNGKETGKVHLAFLMSDKGIRFNPALWLENAVLRVWGVEQRQLVELNGNVADSDWQKLGIEEVEQRIISQTSGRVVLKEISVPYRFEPDPNKVGIAGTIGNGTQIVPMVLAKAPKGVRLRFEIEALKSDGSLESQHWVEGESDGNIVAFQGATGHIYLGAQSIDEAPTKRNWRWEGFEGRTEIDFPDPNGKPREATKILLRLVAVNPPAGSKIEFALFAFPETGGFFTAAENEGTTKQVKVKIGGRKFELGDLRSGEFRQVEIGEVAGGEAIELECNGSKLALVELVGETEGLMCHALRKVRKEKGRFVLDEMTEQGKAFGFYGWDKDISTTCIWHFKQGWQVVNIESDGGRK